MANRSLSTTMKGIRFFLVISFLMIYLSQGYATPQELSHTPNWFEAFLQNSSFVYIMLLLVYTGSLLNGSIRD